MIDEVIDEEWMEDLEDLKDKGGKEINQSVIPPLGLIFLQSLRQDIPQSSFRIRYISLR